MQIKYFKELDKPKDYCLTLVNPFQTEEDRNTEIFNFRLSEEFYFKWKHVFTFIPEIKKDLLEFDIVKWTRVNFIEYPVNYDMILMHEELVIDSYIFNDAGKVTATSQDIRHLLGFCCLVLNFLTKVYDYKKERYLSIKKQMALALKDMKKFYTIYNSVARKFDLYLSNTWFISCFGNLYNTTGKSGHKEANLIYPYMNHIKYGINNPNVLYSYYNEQVKNRERILANECVTRFDIIHYLNFEYSFIAVNQDEKKFYDQVSYDRKLITVILGIVEAQLSLYDFFYKVSKYTCNPSRELSKLSEMTNDFIPDILVRCCGFSKIESTLPNTITTSRINYKEEFANYISKGWKIHFLPPILVNMKTKNVSSLNMDSYIVQRYIENLQDNMMEVII